MARKWIITFGGVGLLPVIPGTYASFAAVLIFYILWLAMGAWACVAVLVLALPLGAATVAMWEWANDYFGKKDARQVVLDEVVGQWLALAFIPLGTNIFHPLPLIAAAFFLFRGFDVAKPFPIRNLEDLPRGWGVLMDDVLAGIFAGVGLWILVIAVHALTGLKATGAAT